MESFRPSLTFLLLSILCTSTAAICQRNPLHLAPGPFPRSSVAANVGEQISSSLPSVNGFTVFSVPGSSNTVVYGLNNLGQIVGTFMSAGVESGFMLDATTDTFTTIAYPGGLYTVAQGVNDEGTIIGWYGDATPSTQGFILQGGLYTSISYPGAYNTLPMGINNRGDIVGDYQLGQGIDQHGFICTGGTFIKFDPPGSSLTILSGINYSREIAGAYCKSQCTGPGGFVYSSGTFTDVNYPGAEITQVAGISDRGDLAGLYSLGHQGAAFIYRKSTQTFVGFDVGRNTSTASGINDSGGIAGTVDKQSMSYGFYKLPNTQP